MKHVFRSLLAISVILTLAGCGKKADDAKKAPDAPALTTVDQKVSYGIGYNMGGGLPKDGITVDQAALVAGIMDGVAGAKTRIPEAELSAAFMEVQQKMNAARAAAGEKQLAAGNDYLAKNKAKPGVKVTASGLQYEVLKSGSGPKPAGPTSTVKVHYHGTLIDGKVFDSSVERKEPVEFALNEVIPGWTEGVQLMSVGDKWKFTIPPAIGYGARGKGDIPPNSVLIFEVELLEVK